MKARSARGVLGGAGTAPLHARRLPIGAEPFDGGVHFRVWAPDRRGVALVVEGGRRVVVRLRPEADGYFTGTCDGIGAGARYRFRLDGGDSVADPASRFQPHGVDGPSQVVDPTSFVWSDAGWAGVGPERQVLYEAHLGTLTREGTFQAATAELPRLAELGVTTLELMPVAEFAGGFGWGYDGVFPFAPFHRYGTPDDLRALIDRAHPGRAAVVLVPSEGVERGGGAALCAGDQGD